MNKEEFINAHLNELVGLLMTSFYGTESTKAGADPDMANRGRAMMAQMRRSRELLSKIWDSTQPKEKPK